MSVHYARWARLLIRLISTLPMAAGGKPKAGTLPPVTPQATPLDEVGSYSITTSEARFCNANGIYRASIYFPTMADQYPAVAFSPGLGATKDMYRAVGYHLASHGYVVVIFTVPRPFTFSTVQHEAGFSSAFEYLAAQNENPGCCLFSRVDLRHRAIIGHSLGGAAATRAGAAIKDLGAIVSLAPSPNVSSEDLAKISAPIQIQASSLDSIVGEQTAISYFSSIRSATKMLVNIKGGNHVGYNDVDSLGVKAGQYFDCKPQIDILDHQQRLARRYYTAWFDYHLKGNHSVEGYLFGKEGERDFYSELLANWEFVTQ